MVANVPCLDLVSCEQPGIYVLDTTELAWKTSYTANTVYTTPDHEEIIAVTGGRGTGSSVAGSGYAIGTGANDTDTSAQFRSKTEDTKGGSGGGSNTGAIAGGVVGGVLGLALLAGLAWYFFIYRKKKREEQEMREKPILNGSPGSQLSGNPYDDPALTRYAADDVEEATAGYNAQFRCVVQASCALNKVRKLTSPLAFTVIWFRGRSFVSSMSKRAEEAGRASSKGHWKAVLDLTIAGLL